MDFINLPKSVQFFHMYDGLYFNDYFRNQKLIYCYDPLLKLKI